MRLVYDRGTILVKDPPPELQPDSLPGVLWDPRVECFRAPGFKYGELKAVLQARGLAWVDHVLSRTPAATAA